MWRGGVGRGISVAAPFGWRCPNSQAVLRFHIPLIEPDVRIYRIRLSDKTLMLSPTEGRACAAPVEPAQAARADTASG